MSHTLPLWTLQMVEGRSYAFVLISLMSSADNKGCFVVKKMHMCKHKCGYEPDLPVAKKAVVPLVVGCALPAA